MKEEDEGLRPVREVRRRISTEFDNDPARIVSHYMLEQERYKERLLPPIWVQQAGPVDNAPRI